VVWLGAVVGVCQLPFDVAVCIYIWCAWVLLWVCASCRVHVCVSVLCLLAPCCASCCAVVHAFDEWQCVVDVQGA